jgi:prevent-host-death family protein
MQVNILEAKNRLSELVKTAAAGEEVIIANRGKPVAKLVKAEETDAEALTADRELEAKRIDAIVTAMHRVSDRPDPFDPLEWDEWGLPK